MIFKNKKAAAEASTLTWMAATFTVVMMMIAFTVFMGLIYLEKNKSEVKVSLDLISKQTETHEIIDFLNSDSGNGETIYELLRKSDVNDVEFDKRKALFREKAGLFLDKKFESSGDTLDISIQLYSLDESSSLTLVEGYGAYNSIQQASESPLIASQTLEITIPIVPDKQIKFVRSFS